MSKEDYIHIYDQVSENMNATFPAFMAKTFGVSEERGKIIAAGREIVAESALFIKKKKYAALVYDLEGTRKDVNGKPGELKVLGLDLKRSDTPKYMQDFLELVLFDTLTGVEQEKIFDRIRQFRNDFRDRPAWEKGTPKRVNGITTSTQLHEDANSISKQDVTQLAVGEKMRVFMAGHVRAAMHWNNMLDMYEDKQTMKITDGAHTIVCKLNANPMGIDSISYPVDEPNIPQWFKQLPFDNAAMEKAIIDSKLDNLLGVLEWDLTLTDDRVVNDFFDW